tara:strand:+ start:618 stop:1094 length:477 start_codon:yes stop_codon:yes gene_type:complete
MDLSTFDASAIEPQAAYQPLPAGWYKCVITNTEEKPTKAQTGSYLELKIEVIEGDYQGRLVFDRLNLKNPNPTAVEIAQRSLSSICRSVGVNNPQDSADLRDKPLMVKLAVSPANGQYEASNEVKGYDAVGDASASPAPAAAAATASVGGGSTPPWKK